MLNYDTIFKGVKKALTKSSSAVSDASDDDFPLDHKVLLSITQKLLAINRGQAEPDVRDSLAFRRTHTPDKLFAERVKLDAGKLKRVAGRRMAKTRNLKPVGISHFDPYLEGLIVGNPLSSPLEEINPLANVEQSRRITQMGPGGIPSEESVTSDAQNIHPSIFGFISSVEGPECHDSKTEVFTRRGWVFWPEILETDQFACRVDGRLEFHKSSRVIRDFYSGVMIGAKARGVNFLVTPNHRFFTATTPEENRFDWATANDIFGKARCFLGSHLPCSGNSNITHFEIPLTSSRYTRNTKKFPPVLIEDWAMFLGWYLSEGSVSHTKSKPAFNKVIISQSKTANPDKCKDIFTLLRRLPFGPWGHYGVNIIATSRVLSEYLRQFGKSFNKFIPEEVFEFPVSARESMLTALISGDGHFEHNGILKYFTTSERLADDVERLMLSLGHVVSRGNVNAGDGMMGERIIHRKHKQHIISALTTRVKYLIPENYFKQQYEGIVYCATVPGGMLLTRRHPDITDSTRIGRGVGFWSGNSSRIGVDTRLAVGAKIGTDGKIYQKMMNRRTGQHQYVSPEDLENKVVGLPQ